MLATKSSGLSGTPYRPNARREMKTGDKPHLYVPWPEKTRPMNDVEYIPWPENARPVKVIRKPWGW